MLTAHLWSKAPLFSTLNSAQIERLGRMSTSRSLEAGQMLFMEQDVCTGFFVLWEGAIQLTRASDTSSLHPTLAVVMPISTFAEAAMFGDEDFPATAMAIKPSKVQHFPKRPFLAALREDPDLAMAMIQSQAVWLRRLTVKVQELTGTDSLERLKGWLREQFSGRDAFRLPIAKKSLAAQLGMTPETLSRSLRTLQDQGCLTVDGTVLRKTGRL